MKWALAIAIMALAGCGVNSDPGFPYRGSDVRLRARLMIKATDTRLPMRDRQKALQELKKLNPKHDMVGYANYRKLEDSQNVN